MEKKFRKLKYNVILLLTMAEGKKQHLNMPSENGNLQNFMDVH